MKRISGFRFPALVLTLAAVAAMTAMTDATSSQQPKPRLTYFPSEDPGVPAYARIEMVNGLPLVHHDDDWAAIAFYRDLTCVPDDFNLLDFSDFAEDPPGSLRVFSCPMTVEGHTIWQTPWPPPLQTVSYGTGSVPVWFVRWEALKMAMGGSQAGEYVLTMSELKALALAGPDVLKKGTATSFKETLLPLGEIQPQRTITQIDARGSTDDGLRFDLQSVENAHSETHDIESRTVTVLRFR